MTHGKTLELLEQLQQQSQTCEELACAIHVNRHLLSKDLRDLETDNLVRYEDAYWCITDGGHAYLQRPAVTRIAGFRRIVLEHLVTTGGETVPAAAASLGESRGKVSAMLLGLEEAGLVHCKIPRWHATEAGKEALAMPVEAELQRPAWWTDSLAWPPTQQLWQLLHALHMNRSDETDPKKLARTLGTQVGLASHDARSWLKLLVSIEMVGCEDGWRLTRRGEDFLAEGPAQPERPAWWPSSLHWPLVAKMKSFLTAVKKNQAIEEDEINNKHAIANDAGMLYRDANELLPVLRSAGVVVCADNWELTDRGAALLDGNLPAKTKDARPTWWPVEEAWPISRLQLQTLHIVYNVNQRPPSSVMISMVSQIASKTRLPIPSVRKELERLVEMGLLTIINTDWVVTQHGDEVLQKLGELTEITPPAPQPTAVKPAAPAVRPTWWSDKQPWPLQQDLYAMLNVVERATGKRADVRSLSIAANVPYLQTEQRLGDLGELGLLSCLGGRWTMTPNGRIALRTPPGTRTTEKDPAMTTASQSAAEQITTSKPAAANDATTKTVAIADKPDWWRPDRSWPMTSVQLQLFRAIATVETDKRDYRHIAESALLTYPVAEQILKQFEELQIAACVETQWVLTGRGEQLRSTIMPLPSSITVRTKLLASEENIALLRYFQTSSISIATYIRTHEINKGDSAAITNLTKRMTALKKADLLQCENSNWRTTQQGSQALQRINARAATRKNQHILRILRGMDQTASSIAEQTGFEEQSVIQQLERMHGMGLVTPLSAHNWRLTQTGETTLDQGLIVVAKLSDQPIGVQALYEVLENGFGKKPMDLTLPGLLACLLRLEQQGFVQAIGGKWILPPTPATVSVATVVDDIDETGEDVEWIQSWQSARGLR